MEREERRFLLFKEILGSLIVPQHIDNEDFIEYILKTSSELSRRALRHFELSDFDADDLPF